MPRHRAILLSTLTALVLLAVGICAVARRLGGNGAPPAEITIQEVSSGREGTPSSERPFDGERAYADVISQVGFGPRIPGTPGHEQTVAWLASSLADAGWETEIQATTMMGHPIRNVIARRPGPGPERPWVIVGAHYDTRIHADLDPDPNRQRDPVPGANDGASGVAVLLELARVLPRELNFDLWLVFFDAEDNGGIPGWDWILGSRAFVNSLEEKPDAVVIADMVGDRDLNIYLERNSDALLARQIWGHARELGYRDYFILEYKYSILDDHTPFLRAGVRAVDIIDFDYAYFHTTEDDVDKVSPESLKVVGDTLMAWLLALSETGDL